MLQGPRAQRSLVDSRQVLSVYHCPRAQIELRHWARVSRVQAQALRRRDIVLVFSEEGVVWPLYVICYLAVLQVIENLDGVVGINILVWVDDKSQVRSITILVHACLSRPQYYGHNHQI